MHYNCCFASLRMLCIAKNFNGMPHDCVRAKGEIEVLSCPNINLAHVSGILNCNVTSPTLLWSLFKLGPNLNSETAKDYSAQQK